MDGLSRDEGRVGRGEEDVGRSELGRHTDSADGSGRLSPLAEGVLVHGSGLQRSPDRSERRRRRETGLSAFEKERRKEETYPGQTALTLIGRKEQEYVVSVDR
jgi:hypothetical protein